MKRFEKPIHDMIDNALDNFYDHDNYYKGPGAKEQARQDKAYDEWQEELERRRINREIYFSDTRSGDFIQDRKDAYATNRQGRRIAKKVLKMINEGKTEDLAPVSVRLAGAFSYERLPYELLGNIAKKDLGDQAQDLDIKVDDGHIGQSNWERGPVQISIEKSSEEK